MGGVSLFFAEQGGEGVCSRKKKTGVRGVTNILEGTSPARNFWGVLSRNFFGMFSNRFALFGNCRPVTGIFGNMWLADRSGKTMPNARKRLVGFSRYAHTGIFKSRSKFLPGQRARQKARATPSISEEG